LETDDDCSPSKGRNSGSPAGGVHLQIGKETVAFAVGPWFFARHRVFLVRQGSITQRRGKQDGGKNMGRSGGGHAFRGAKETAP